MTKNNHNAEDRARKEFEQLLNDDKDFKKDWGDDTEENGYSELSFQEWFEDYFCNLNGMKTYKVTLNIRAECKADAEELLNDYTGQETDLEIIKIDEVKE